MKATILAIVVLAFSVSQASAVSHAVKMACAADYFAHCSMHAVGSPGVRKCMRAVGPRLSSRCISALVEAGEVKSKVASKKTYKAKTYAAKSVSKKQVAARKLSKNSKKQFAEKRNTKKVVAESRVRKKQYASKPSKKRYSKKQLTRLAEG